MGSQQYIFEQYFFCNCKSTLIGKTRQFILCFPNIEDIYKLKFGGFSNKRVYACCDWLDPLERQIVEKPGQSSSIEFPTVQRCNFTIIQDLLCPKAVLQNVCYDCLCYLLTFGHPQGWEGTNNQTHRHKHGHHNLCTKSAQGQFSEYIIWFNHTNI